MMGAERRSMVMTEEEKRNRRIRSGHAIVGLSVPEHDPVYKVTIIPRGRALGVTMFLPEADRYSTSKRQLESRIATLFGGRIAEELVFGRMPSPPVPPTTSNAPRSWRATWSRAGDYPIAWVRKLIARNPAKCSWGAASRSTSKSPTSRRT